MNRNDCMQKTNTDNEKQTALVTGGAGFIGSHLCRELMNRGRKVICLDNFLTGKRSHVEDLLDREDFSLVEADVVDPFCFEADEIYHLACPASPVHYREDPLYTARVCFLGALHALELAEKMGAKVLLTSTSEVYGEPEVHPQPESYHGNVNPIGPRACYDEGKRIAETLFFDAWRTKGTDIRVVRIFNTYGPCMEANDGRIVSNFITQALQGEDITIYGDGTQTRSFCYVEDTVEALIRMMGSEQTGPVNIGNPEERSVLSAAQEILRQTGSDSRLVYRALPTDDPTRRRPDISLAKSTLGWEPEIPFEEGIRRTIRWFSRQTHCS